MQADTFIYAPRAVVSSIYIPSYIVIIYILYYCFIPSALDSLLAASLIALLTLPLTEPCLLACIILSIDLIDEALSKGPRAALSICITLLLSADVLT